MEHIKHSEAYARGFTPDLLRRSPLYVHPTDGVAQPAATADDLASTCRAVATMLRPDAVFTHLTSAALRDWWMPLGAGFPLVACTDGESTHHDRRGVYVRRCDIPPGHRSAIGDLAVASPEWTIVEVAEHLALLDLVAMIDSALHLGHTTVEQVRATMRPGRRGVRVLRRALDLVDGRSESWWESMLRLLHVLSGIAVEPQHEVLNAAGVVVARTDLRIMGTMRVPEYDGAEHRGRERHQHDLRRDKALARAGLQRYGYIATELVNDPQRVVRDAEDAVGLPHLPARAQAWLVEARLASITVAGRRALDRRMERFVRTTSGRVRRASGADPVASAGDVDDTPSRSARSTPLAGRGDDWPRVTVFP